MSVTSELPVAYEPPRIEDRAPIDLPLIGTTSFPT